MVSVRKAEVSARDLGSDHAGVLQNWVVGQPLHLIVASLTHQHGILVGRPG